MPIIDGLKNAVAANTARAANNVAVNGLRSIASNVFGVDLNPTNPAAKLTNRPTKFTTTMLQFPANVEGDDQQGHYIIFEILQQNKAKLKAAKNLRDAKKVAALEYSNPAATVASTAYAKSVLSEAEDALKKLIAAQAHLESGITSLSGDGNSLQLSNPSTVTTSTMIALYMPAQVQVQYNSKYGPTEISSLAGAGAAALDAFAGRNGADFDTALDKAFGEGKMGLETGLMKILDTAAPGATALLALEKGAVRTPRMELMFEGIGRREFAYEFTFIPKDAAEAKIVKNIVYEFKYHMAANYTDGTFREMDIPSFFNIVYKHKTKDNDYLNKISTCALESMDVSYGGDRFVAYQDGAPQTTKLSLKFKELEIITKDAIEAGA